MQQNIITWGPFALALAMVLWLVWPALKRWRIRRRLERAIAATGLEQMRDVLLDNGMGGLSYYEWLLLTPSTIRVLQLNGRSGLIFAGERMDSWAQVVGKRTAHFDNPLHQLDDNIATLRYHLPKLPLEGDILFTGQCEFPKGRPARLKTLVDLQQEAELSEGTTAQPVLKQAWEALQKKVRAVDPASEGYLLPVRETASPFRSVLALIVSLAALGWLLWRLLGA